MSEPKLKREEYNQEMSELLKILHHSGYTPEQAFNLVARISATDFQLGWTAFRNRFVKYLTDRRKMSVEILGKNGLLRDDQEIVIPIQELLDLLKTEASE